jgi:phosphate transport system substrate-binding protein
MIKRTLLSLMGAAAMLVSISSAQAADFKAHGSATVAKGIVKPNQAAIEGAFGGKVAVVMNGSGGGLKDLAAGKSDIAMISADLSFEVEQVKKKGGKVDGVDFKAVAIGTKKINYIVHPSNSVGSLTAEQVTGILSGKITDWSEVGGKAGPILVVAEKTGQGTRGSVEIGMLGGSSIKSDAKTFKALSQVAKVVGQAPNAFGYGNSSSISSKVKVVSGVETDQPLSLVTIGAPNAAQSKFIEAVKSVS